MRNVKKTDEKGKRKPVVKWMLVWKKKKEIRKGRNNIKRFFFKKFLLARAVLIISILFWSFIPLRDPHTKWPPCPPHLNKQKDPHYSPLTQEPTKKNFFSEYLSLLHSLSYSLSLLSLYNILLFVMNISISEHFAYLLWATNLA